ncbi:MAG: uroporphyrinogen decarboxylase family protein [Spirochaetales bacterium]
MDNRERLLHLASNGTLPDNYVPAAFFLHFSESAHRGKAAVDAHLDYYRATGNDLIKVQYEHNYPLLNSIQNPVDWKSMPIYGEEFYADQLDVVEGVVKAAGNETVVIVTLYSPFMFAEQAVGPKTLLDHLEADPAAVESGLERIVASMEIFIDGCVKRGVDGFYASTQGGEAGRIKTAGVFDDYVKPTDLSVWQAIGDRTPCNVLHVCDYVAPYEDYDRYLSYPGQIVSAPNELVGGHITGAQIAELFGRPFLGGMERLGAISTGPKEEVEARARQALAEGSANMILGADCTLRPETDRGNIAAATGVAHRYRAG